MSVPRSARGPVHHCSQPLSLLRGAVLLDPNPGPGVPAIPTRQEPRTVVASRGRGLADCSQV